MAVKGGESGTVTILHPLDIQTYTSAAFRPFHPLGKRVTGFIQILYYLIGFQT